MNYISDTFLHWLVAQREVNTYTALCFVHCQGHENEKKRNAEQTVL